MCKPDVAPVKKKAKSTAPPRLLLSLDSYTSSVDDDASSTTKTTTAPPPLSSCLATCALGLLVLVILEQSLRYLLAVHGPQWHALLEIEVNRQILARHFAVDAFSCAGVAILGWMGRDAWWPVLQSGQSRIPVAGWEDRLFKFRPDGYRLSLFFFTFQVKNMIDTLIWNDVRTYIVVVHSTKKTISFFRRLPIAPSLSSVLPRFIYYVFFLHRAPSLSFTTSFPWLSLGAPCSRARATCTPFSFSACRKSRRPCWPFWPTLTTSSAFAASEMPFR